VYSCIKDCEGRVYATGFEMTQSGNTLQVDARCVSEATCGGSDEWDADPARLVYSSGFDSLGTSPSELLTVPSWQGTGQIDIIVTGLDLCGSDASCAE
jgi:hypothetical protein